MQSNPQINDLVASPLYTKKQRRKDKLSRESTRRKLIRAATYQDEPEFGASEEPVFFIKP
jgi:hypothetical protein